MNNENLNELITEALAIEARDTKEAGALGFMARALVQATLPHSKQESNEFTRQNGLFTLSILSPEKIGLPFGNIPRLLISWVITEAVRTRQREIILGDSLSQFMAQLDLVPTGGRWGSTTRLKEQMKRLFSSSISCTYDNGENWAIRNVQPVVQANLWWNPKVPEQTTFFESTLTLGEDFFKEVTDHPVPVDMDVIKAIKQSSLAIDIYCWLTYRMSYLRKATTIPWKALQAQFGSNYADSPQGTRDFKRAFLRELRKVSIFYNVNAEDKKIGLHLRSSSTHVKKQLKPSNEKSCQLIKKIEESSKQQEKKKERARYEAYRFGKVVEIIENEISKEERKTLIAEFDDYLFRRRLSKLHYVKNNLMESDITLKRHLCEFITSRWNHLLSTIQSYDEFIESLLVVHGSTNMILI